tara:strand:+ start:238 stop:441 length:204 start_codon:yes stop_codon:yes gene_type:complete
MTSRLDPKLKANFFDPEQNSPRKNFVISCLFCALFFGAGWFALTSTLEEMTMRDCASGIQKACDSLK